MSYRLALCAQELQLSGQEPPWPEEALNAAMTALQVPQHEHLGLKVEADSLGMIDRTFAARARYRAAHSAPNISQKLVKRISKRLDEPEPEESPEPVTAPQQQKPLTLAARESQPQKKPITLARLEARTDDGYAAYSGTKIWFPGSNLGVID
jgi:hypothetical protein